MTTRTKGIIAGAATAAVLMAAFTAWDLGISNALVGEARWFARVFETIGQLPFALIMYAAPMILLYGSKSRNAFVGVLRAIGWGLLSLLGALFSVVQTFQYIWGENMESVTRNMPLIAAIAVLLFVAIAVLLRKVDGGKLAFARRFAIVGLLLVVLDMATVETLKNIFGRTRPREMGVDGAVFGNWFELHGKTGRKSFPSGHTAYAFAAAAWALLWKPGSAGRRNVLALGILFGVLTGLSRVLIGAHFPTDATMGGAITLAWLAILTAIVKEKRIDA